MEVPQHQEIALREPSIPAHRIGPAFTVHDSHRNLERYAFRTLLNRNGFEDSCETFVILTAPEWLEKVLTKDEIGEILPAVNPNTGIGDWLPAIAFLKLASGPRDSEVIAVQLFYLELIRVDSADFMISGRFRVYGRPS